tara:strand:+ start:502 stop:675 length:174 start_codon:yes stop_codon:yes gene_type:complete
MGDITGFLLCQIAFGVVFVVCEPKVSELVVYAKINSAEPSNAVTSTARSSRVNAGGD